MEMSIDKAIPKIQFVRNALNDDMEIAKAYDLVIDTMRKYQQLQADYNARLKADMVAMLTDIQLEIEELKNEPACCHHFERGVNRSSEVIQQRIDKLKGEQA